MTKPSMFNEFLNPQTISIFTILNQKIFTLWVTARNRQLKPVSYLRSSQLIIKQTVFDRFVVWDFGWLSKKAAFVKSYSAQLLKFPISVEQTAWLLPLGTQNPGRGCWSLRKLHFSKIGPFARSDHMARNKLHREANFKTKESRAGLVRVPLF